MNILEQENIIKGAPDEVLLQEAQAPSGQLPQFLVVSEIQRRKEMRNRFAAQETQPEQTVSEQIVAEASAPQGIAGLASEMPSQAPSMPMPQQTIPQEMMVATEAPIDPQMLMAAGGGMMPYPAMAGGGIVEMQEGRQVPRSEGLQRAIMEVLTGKYTPEDKLINELVRRSGIPILRDVHSKRGTLNLSRPGIFGKNSEMALRYNPRHKSGGVQFIKRFQDGGLTTQGDEIDPNNGADGISTNPYQAFIDAQQDKYDSLKEYMTETLRKDEERQRKSMMSDALINIGAGIASGNIGAGLEKAGASVAATRKAQRDREQAVQLQLMKEMPGGAGSYTDLPSSVREYQFFIGLSPSEQARYLNLKRQTQKIADINGVPTIVSLVGNTYFDLNNNPVTPDAGTVVRELPSTDVSPTDVSPTDVSPTVVPEVSAVIAPSGVQTVPLTTHAEALAAERRKEQSEFTEEQRQERITGAPFAIDTYSAFTTKSNEVDRALEDVMEILDENPGAAGYGSLMRFIPESQARRLARRLSTIQARLAFGELQDMRNASKTGGALGQVSERELDLLRDASIALDQGASAEDLRGQIDLVIRRYKKFRSDALQRYSEMMLDPLYENQYQIQSRFAGDLNQFKEDLIQGDATQKRTALEFFGHYQRAGGVVPDDIQAAISNLQSAETTTEEASPEDLERLQMLNEQLDAERQK